MVNKIVKGISLVVQSGPLKIKVLYIIRSSLDQAASARIEKWSVTRSWKKLFTHDWTWCNALTGSTPFHLVKPLANKATTIQTNKQNKTANKQANNKKQAHTAQAQSN